MARFRPHPPPDGIFLLALVLAACSRQETRLRSPSRTKPPPIPAPARPGRLGHRAHRRRCRHPQPLTGQDGERRHGFSDVISEGMLHDEQLHAQAEAVPGGVMGDFARPTHLHVPSAPRRQVAGRRALHRRRREVHLRQAPWTPRSTRAVRSYFSTIKSCEVVDPYTVRFIATERYFKTLEVLGTTAHHPQARFRAGRSRLQQHPFGATRSAPDLTNSCAGTPAHKSSWSAMTITGDGPKPLSQADCLPDHRGALRRRATY